MNAVDELLLKWANGGLTSSEKEELSKHYDIADLDRFIDDSGKLELETSNVKTEWDKISTQLKNDSTKSNLKSKSKYLRWVISALLLLAAGIWYVISLGPDKTIENTTYEPLLIAMEDDTEIMLSPGSTLSYNKSRFADHRKVWLDGRAYFDVRIKGEFSVVTDNSITSVLGTTFDIWELDDDKVIVQCFTGKVSVSTSKGMEATLIAGQKYTESIGTGEVENGSKPKWLSNSIVFDRLALYLVYKDLEKYYPIKFVGEISSLNFNGELPTDNLQKVTEILNAVTPETYKIEKDKVVVSKSE